MSVVYPRNFNISGVIELRYSDYFYLIKNEKNENEYSRSFIQQRYRLVGQGYVYHPRLIVFTAGITYRDSRQISAVRKKTNSHDLGYDLSATFLPYRPIAADIYARKTDYTVDHWPFGTVDRSTTEYGVRLRIRKSKLPVIRLEYNHRDQELFGWGAPSGTIKSDEYIIDIRGYSNFLRTNYLGSFRFVDYSSPIIRYKAKYLRFNTRTVLSKNVLLSNTFNYSDIDFSKILGFGSNMDISVYQRFKQYYMYNFYRSERQFEGLEQQGVLGINQKQDIHSLTGTWSYRFTNRLYSTFSLNYGLRKENDDKANFYGVSFAVSYGRPLAFFDLAPKYRFHYRKDESKGYLFENNVQLNLITRKMRLGIWYTNYALTLLNEKYKYKQKAEDEFGFEETIEERETKIDSITHSFRTGIKGRGVGQRLTRMQWNIEAEIFFSRATIERTKRDTEEDFSFDEQAQTEIIKRETSRYSISGDISYPVGWATIIFSTGYSIGESNSRSRRRFFYEERIQYPIMKNLSLSVLWKELWERIEDGSDEKIREYALAAEYRLGKIICSLEGRILSGKSDDRERYTRRAFLRLRRLI